MYHERYMFTKQLNVSQTKGDRWFPLNHSLLESIRWRKLHYRHDRKLYINLFKGTRRIKPFWPTPYDPIFVDCIYIIHSEFP